MTSDGLQAALAEIREIAEHDEYLDHQTQLREAARLERRRQCDREAERLMYQIMSQGYGPASCSLLSDALFEAEERGTKVF